MRYRSRRKKQQKSGWGGPAYWRPGERLEVREEGKIGEGRMAIDYCLFCTAKGTSGISSRQDRSVKRSLLPVQIKHVWNLERRKWAGFSLLVLALTKQSSTFSPRGFFAIRQIYRASSCVFRKILRSGLKSPANDAKWHTKSHRFGWL